MPRIIPLAAITLLLISLIGCTTSSPQKGNIRSTQLNSDQIGWWYARFPIPFPIDSEPDWHIGTLIGGEVIAPLIEQYGSDVLLWRVHRRANHDNAGHTFSFIFYSSATVAQQIYKTIETNPAIKQLTRSGRLLTFKKDNVNHNTRPDIEDTSDPGWPSSIQVTWPAYAMGVSQLWVGLVDELAVNKNRQDSLEEHYQTVHENLSLIWRQQGQHALLHHLNAIFAYEPLLIQY